MYKSIDSTRIRNLKVVAKLKTGERLRTRAHYYSVDAYTSPFLSYKPLMRMLYGEGKDETVDSLTKLVESCVKQVGLTPGDEKRLSRQLKDVIKGINNLSETYKDDSGAVAGLEHVKEVAEDFICIHDPSYVRETNPTVVEDVDQIEIEEEEVSD